MGRSISSPASGNSLITTPVLGGFRPANFSGSANLFTTWGLVGGVVYQTITGASLVDVVNLNSPGSALLLAMLNGSVGPQAPQIVVTRDGVVEYDGSGAGFGAYAGVCLIGAVSVTGNLASSGFALALDEIRFASSFRIQAKAGTSGSISIAHRERTNA